MLPYNTKLAAPNLVATLALQNVGKLAQDEVRVALAAYHNKRSAPRWDPGGPFVELTPLLLMLQNFVSQIIVLTIAPFYWPCLFDSWIPGG